LSNRKDGDCGEPQMAKLDGLKEALFVAPMGLVNDCHAMLVVLLEKVYDRNAVLKFLVSLVGPKFRPFV